MHLLVPLFAAAAALAQPAPAWPDLTSPPKAALGGGAKDAAVVVGIEDYAFVPDVPGAARNAEDWYRHLTRDRKVPIENVILLRNSEANLENLRDALAKAAGYAKPGGTLWFVFVGHGAPALDGQDGVLVGFDAQQNAKTLYARSLPRAELLKAVGKGERVEAVVVLDACFSGRAGDGAPLAPGLQPMLPVADAKAAASPVTVLSAGKAHQLAGPLPGAGRPAFSYLVLGALRGWGDADADGQVTADEVVTYAHKVLRVTVKDREQTPERHGPARVLGKSGREAGPDLAAMVLGPAPTPGPTPGPKVTQPEPAPRPSPPPAASSCSVLLDRMCAVVSKPMCKEMRAEAGQVTAEDERECAAMLASPAQLNELLEGLKQMDAMLRREMTDEWE